MKIVILSGSPRKGGNTDILVEAFGEKAKAAGHALRIYRVASMTIHPCLGCDGCNPDGVCVQKDDMAEISEAIRGADVLLFASPIYWFSVSAQLKAVIDRLYSTAFSGSSVKKAALLLNSGSPDVFTPAVEMYREIIAYLGWEDAGILLIPDMAEKGSMRTAPQLREVEALVRNL